MNALQPPAVAEPDRDFASTLAAGMSLLSAFREGDGALAHRDLVERTGLAKSNVSRLAFTLLTLGFLRRDASGCYRLGSPVLSMGYPLLAGMRVRQVARPYMRELANEIRGTVSMGLRDRARMIYVESCSSDASADHPVDIGTALPLLDSAMGLAWLAAATAADSERALNQALVALGRQHQAEARRPVRLATRQFALQGYVERIGATGRQTVARPLRGLVDGDLVVIDCAASRRGRSASRAAALGQRLIRTVGTIEAAMSVR